MKDDNEYQLCVSLSCFFPVGLYYISPPPFFFSSSSSISPFLGFGSCSFSFSPLSLLSLSFFLFPIRYPQCQPKKIAKNPPILATLIVCPPQLHSIMYRILESYRKSIRGKGYLVVCVVKGSIGATPSFLYPLRF